jgi:4-amino-4-deoxy-L-arabinose transferase-like glycosyltransferase
MGSENDAEPRGAPVAAKSAGTSSHVLAFIKSRRFREELLILVPILALCCVIRWYRITPVDFYEDTVNKWHFIRQWFYDNDFSHATWTHHMARFGVNVPVYMVQLFFGRSPYAYYVAPFLVYVGQVLVLYYLGRRLGGRPVGVMAALIRATFTGMDQGSNQLFPDGFGGLAALIACYFLVRYEESSDQNLMRLVVATGLAMVWEYLIK